MPSHTLTKRPTLTIIGIECRTSNDPDAAPKDIPALWERFYGEDIINKIPNKNSKEVIALYCDYEGDHTKPYTVVIGCSVSSHEEIPEGMVAKTAPKGSYADFRALGEFPKSLIETWQKIWAIDLPRTFTGDYEVYGEKFTSGPPQEVELFIAIEDV